MTLELVQDPEIKVYGAMTGHPMESICIELEFTLFTIIESVGGVAKFVALDQFSPAPIFSNGSCTSTKRIVELVGAAEPTFAGTWLSTSATNQFVLFDAVEETVGDDCTSISFKPPKLGIKELTTGIIIF